MSFWNLFKKKQEPIITTALHQLQDVSKSKDTLIYKIGDRIGGDYLIKAIFGGFQKSGMGVVYVVENRLIEYPIVLKTYQDAKDKTGFAQQFRKEAEAWIAVGVHRNIVKALRVDTIDFRLFVAAEFIPRDSEGRNNIRDYISCGPVNPFWILTWATQFCHGMRYALSKGMVAHCDIKPENLMVDSSYTLKITDFGLAFLSKTRDSFSGGTLPYMAPEQILTPQFVDHRADIYAFGIIMFEMLTGGEYPYEILARDERRKTELVQAHLKGKLKTITSPLFCLIERCLRKNPSERYQSYDEFLEHIQDVAKEMHFNLQPAWCRTNDDECEELYVRACSLNSLGKHEEALRLITEYNRKYPDNSDGWTERGKILMVLNRLKEAEEAFLKSVELFFYGSPVWNNLGVL